MESSHRPLSSHALKQRLTFERLAALSIGNTWLSIFHSGTGGGRGVGSERLGSLKVAMHCKCTHEFAAALLVAITTSIIITTGADSLLLLGLRTIMAELAHAIRRPNETGNRWNMFGHGLTLFFISQTLISWSLFV